MHDRILAAVGERTYRHLGDLTNTHPETVRRYLQGQTPSVDFIAALSTALGISAEWLLTGRGPMKTDQLKAHALATADASELMHAMAETLDKLVDRVDRVEVYMQTLETRVRAQYDSSSEPGAAAPSPVSSAPTSGPLVVKRGAGVDGSLHPVSANARRPQAAGTDPRSSPTQNPRGTS